MLVTAVTISLTEFSIIQTEGSPTAKFVAATITNRISGTSPHTSVVRPTFAKQFLRSRMKYSPKRLRLKVSDVFISPSLLILQTFP